MHCLFITSLTGSEDKAMCNNYAKDGLKGNLERLALFLESRLGRSVDVVMLGRMVRQDWEKLMTLAHAAHNKLKEQDDRKIENAAEVLSGLSKQELLHMASSRYLDPGMFYAMKTLLGAAEKNASKTCEIK